MASDGSEDTQKCESSEANRFSRRLVDRSARARSFRLKSQWTKSAPGPRGPSRFLFGPPPNLTFVLVSSSGLRFLSPRGLVCREAHTNCRVQCPSGLKFSRPSTRLLEVIPLSGIPLLQNSGLVGWVTPVHSRVDLLERGTGYWDILIFFFPIGSSRVFFSARPLSDVAASQVPSVPAAAAILYF